MLREEQCKLQLRVTAIQYMHICFLPLESDVSLLIAIYIGLRHGPFVLRCRELHINLRREERVRSRMGLRMEC